jgi:hypothetical protein
VTGPGAGTFIFDGSGGRTGVGALAAAAGFKVSGEVGAAAAKSGPDHPRKPNTIDPIRRILDQGMGIFIKQNV